MRRLAVVCLSLVCLILSLPVSRAQEILYDRPAWVKGYGAVHFVTSTPDNSRIVVSTSNGLYLLNPQTPDVTPTELKGQSDTIQFSGFSKDGSLLATSSLDGTVSLWRMPSGEAVWNVRVTDPCCIGAHPTTVNFSDDASLFLVGLSTRDPAGAVVMNVRSGKTQRIDTNISPYSGYIQGADVLYGKQNADGFYIGRLHADGDNLAEMPVATLSGIQALSDPTKNGILLFTPDYAVVTTDKDTLVVVNLKDGSRSAEIAHFPPFFSHFGNVLLGWSADKVVSALNLETGARVDVPTLGGLGAGTSQWLPYVDTAGMMALLDLKTLTTTPFAPLSTTYSWAHGYMIYLDSQSFKVFDVRLNKTTTLDGTFAPDSDQYITAWVTDNKVLLSYQSAGLFYSGIWDITTGAVVVEPQAFKALDVHNSRTDNNWTATSAQDISTGNRGVLVADLKAGNLQFYPTDNVWQPHPEQFFGDQLLYYGSDYRLLNVTTGEDKPLLTDDYKAHDLAFSPDGKQVATVGSDKTVRLWDANTGAQVGIIGLSYTPVSLAYGERGVAVVSNNQVQFLPIPAAVTPTNIVTDSGTINAIALHANVIAAAGIDHVQLFNLNSADTLSNGSTLVPDASLVILDRYGTVALNDRYIAAAGYTRPEDSSLSEMVVDLWSATTRKFVTRLHGRLFGQTYNLSFSPDGSRLALTGGGETLVWNMERSLEEPAFVTAGDVESGSAFAGNILATLERSWLTHSIELYSQKDGLYVGTLRRAIHATSGGGGGDGYHIPISASANGRHVAFVDASGELVMWNMPDQVALVAQSVATRKANIIPYCDSLGGVAVNPTQSQAVNLSWSWFATDIPQIFDHILNAQYEIKIDSGTPLPMWNFQRSAVRRDAANDNHWTVYYSFDIGMLNPGVHTISYRLTWKYAINDGITDYGPGTTHPEDSGTCTFTVN